MRKVRGVIACNCDPERTSFTFNDDAPLAILRSARTVAWYMGMRFRGPCIAKQAGSLDDTISVLALKLNMDVDRFKLKVLLPIKIEDELSVAGRDVVRAACGLAAHVCQGGGAADVSEWERAIDSRRAAKVAKEQLRALIAAASCHMGSEAWHAIGVSSDHASGESAQHGVQGLAQVWMESDVAGAATSSIRRSFAEDDHGESRQIHASSGRVRVE